MEHYGNNTQNKRNSVYAVFRICYMEIKERCSESFQLHIRIYEQQGAGKEKQEKKVDQIPLRYGAYKPK